VLAQKRRRPFALRLDFEKIPERTDLFEQAVVGVADARPQARRRIGRVVEERAVAVRLDGKEAVRLNVVK